MALLTSPHSTTVDLTGVVAALLRRYAQLLEGYRRQVTGDPSALRTAAAARSADADRITGTGSELTARSRELADQWSGLAAGAYQGAARELGADLAGTGGELRRYSGTLTAAATALESARSRTDLVIGSFDRQARQLVASCAAVPAGQIGTVLAAVRSLGDSAVAGAAGAALVLGQELAALATGLTAGPAPG